MPKFVDIEPLELEFEKRYLDYRKRSQREFPGYIQVDESLTVAAMIMESCLDSLREAPAVDVAPVRHGRWIKNGMYWSCSLCGRSFHYRMEPQWWHGCPNCLAKMDGCNNDEKGGNDHVQD